MPFKSKSQIGTCYKNKKKGWDCDKFLKETKSVCRLPWKKGKPVRTRRARKGELKRYKSKIKTGPRGGKYFTITEKDSNGVLCVYKVYV